MSEPKDILAMYQTERILSAIRRHKGKLTRHDEANLRQVIFEELKTINKNIKSCTTTSNTAAA